MAEHYEVQVRQEGGEYGYVVTITTAGASWTSRWQAVEGATTTEAVLSAARHEVAELRARLNGLGSAADE